MLKSLSLCFERALSAAEVSVISVSSILNAVLGGWAEIFVPSVPSAVLLGGRSNL